MNAYLEILRPFNALMGVIAVLLVAIISGNFNLYVPVACVIVFIFTGAGNAINDYFDHKIDAINKPERPIPSGRISLNSAAIYATSLFVIATIMALIIGIIPGIIVVLSAILMFLYAYKLKKSCLVGNLSIAFLTGLCFVFAGVVLGTVFLSILSWILRISNDNGQGNCKGYGRCRRRQYGGCKYIPNKIWNEIILHSCSIFYDTCKFNKSCTILYRYF